MILIILASLQKLNAQRILLILHLYIVQISQFPHGHRLRFIHRTLGSCKKLRLRFFKLSKYHVTVLQHLPECGHLLFIHIDKTKFRRMPVYKPEDLLRFAFHIPGVNPALHLLCIKGLEQACQAITEIGSHTQNLDIFFLLNILDSAGFHKNPAGMLVYLSACLCDFHASRPALQKLYLQLRFQRLDRLTDMGLRSVQYLRSSFQTAAVHTDHKVLQLFQIHLFSFRGQKNSL